MFAWYHRTGGKKAQTAQGGHKKSLLEIRNPDFLTSSQIRSTDLLGVLQEKFLDKGGAETNGISIGIARGDSGNGHKKNLNVSD